LQWEGAEPTEEEKQTKYDALADNLSERLLALSTRRVWCEHIEDWKHAYHASGKGSTSDRACITGNGIYKPAAPVPDIVPSPDHNRFLEEVVGQVKGAAKEIGARLQ